MLRVGAPEWPHGELSVLLGTINTIILISSSVTMVMAWASLKINDWGKHRLYLIATFVLAAVFLVNKYFEYSEHFGKGEGPWHSTFFAIYFTLTGLHGLHVSIGVLVLGGVLIRSFMGHFSARSHFGVEGTVLYWHFVDVVWIALLLALYLL